MKHVKELFSTILDGKSVSSEQAKYYTMYYVCSILNIIHLVIFVVLNIYLLAAVNLICLSIFFAMKRLITYNRFFACMMITYGNIYIYQIIVSVFIGWNFGFTYYIFGLIPVIFYLNFSNPTSSRSNRVPIIILLLSLGCFLIARYLSSIHGPIHPITSVVAINTIFTINSIICYLIVMLFCALYILEMKASQRYLQEHNNHLRYLADCDPLTSLLNRRSMMDYIVNAYDNFEAGNSNYCIILCDIDDFKQTNDTYGHDCGDMVLIQCAKLIREGLGDDSKICRWGGEEILMLVPWNLNYCIEQIELLRKKLESFIFLYQQHKVKITMTFGIKAYESELTVHELIQIADHNMYKGKKAGKNCVIAG